MLNEKNAIGIKNRNGKYRDQKRIEREKRVKEEEERQTDRQTETERNFAGFYLVEPNVVSLATKTVKVARKKYDHKWMNIYIFTCTQTNEWDDVG